MWDSSTAGWPICINHMLCTLTPWVLMNARRSCKDHDTLSSLFFSSSYSFSSSSSLFWPQNFWWMHGYWVRSLTQSGGRGCDNALIHHHHHHHQCRLPPLNFLSHHLRYHNHYRHRHDHHQHHWHVLLVARLGMWPGRPATWCVAFLPIIFSATMFLIIIIVIIGKASTWSCFLCHYRHRHHLHHHH